MKNSVNEVNLVQSLQVSLCLVASKHVHKYVSSPFCNLQRVQMRTDKLKGSIKKCLRISAMDKHPIIHKNKLKI